MPTSTSATSTLETSGDAPARAHPWPVLREARIVAAQPLSSGLLRITLHGEDLRDLPAPHESPSGLMLLLPERGELDAPLPKYGPRGVIWPEGKSPVFDLAGPYEHAPLDATLTVDIGAAEGESAAWQCRARKGSRVGVTHAARTRRSG